MSYKKLAIKIVVMILLAVAVNYAFDVLLVPAQNDVFINQLSNDDYSYQGMRLYDTIRNNWGFAYAAITMLVFFKEIKLTFLKIKNKLS